MEIIGKVKGWAIALAELGVSLAALMIIVEVLGLGNLPFFPVTSVVANVAGMLGALGSEGLMGIVALWILWAIWNKK
jgi:hypothetical protein